MIRRLNYTGRKRIARSKVTVRLTTAVGGHPAFEIDYDLAAYGFPPDARIFVEAYNSGSYMRFPFGTVAGRRDPDDVRLVEITPRPLPKFRLKIVDQSARSGDWFFGLVYPEIVRALLHEIVIEQGVTDAGLDDSDWHCLWLRFVCSMPGVSEPPAGDSEEARSQRMEWIQAAVQAFCRSRHARRRVEAAIHKEMS